MEYNHIEINEIKNQLDILSNKIENLENKIDLLIKCCGKMDGHINFIETTYNNVRSPLNFIKNKIEYYIGNNNVEDLPAIDLPINNT